jgi:hypothetical protein
MKAYAFGLAIRYFKSCEKLHSIGYITLVTRAIEMVQCIVPGSKPYATAGNGAAPGVLNPGRFQLHKPLIIATKHHDRS